MAPKGSKAKDSSGNSDEVLIRSATIFRDMLRQQVLDSTAMIKILVANIENLEATYKLPVSAGTVTTEPKKKKKTPVKKGSTEKSVAPKTTKEKVAKPKSVKIVSESGGSCSVGGEFNYMIDGKLILFTRIDTLHAKSENNIVMNITPSLTKGGNQSKTVFKVDKLVHPDADDSDEESGDDKDASDQDEEEDEEEEDPAESDDEFTGEV